MVIGSGSTSEIISEEQVFEYCLNAFREHQLVNKRILALIPDHSRTAPIDMMFRVIYNIFADQVKALDFLVALGTHPPMSDEAINQRVGITQQERISKYKKSKFFNHYWKAQNQLKVIGTISEDEVAEISNDLMKQKVDVTINKMVFDYDVIMIIGPTFPHEVVGFSGGNKYLFPGIAGQEIIDMFHWLGALMTNQKIIGKKESPVREIVNKATSFLPMQRICFSLVVRGEDLSGIFIGSPEQAFSAAADLSDKVHITYKPHAFRSVLSCAPKMYDDIWTGGKCMYKLEPVVADGGELIIYAPHITEISTSHGDIIEQIGYHVRDYFVKQMKKFTHIPAGVMAHSTHVKGVGSYYDGIEKPRITVTLATQISKEACDRINLQYCDPHKINIEEWKNRENEGILCVEKAGEILYRLKK